MKYFLCQEHSLDDVDPVLSGGDGTGVEDDCSEDPDCVGVTYNACMTAYKASLDKEDGRSIWIDQSGVEVTVQCVKN